MTHETEKKNTIPRGLYFMILAYAIYSVQDAIAKLLVQTFSVWQVVFFKGMIIAMGAFLIGGPKSIVLIISSQNKIPLLYRGVINFLATFFFFLSTRSLGLAEATTILFVAPILVVLLSVLILRERVTALRWVTVAAGLLGAVIAVNPTGEIHLPGAISALASAFFWALGVILIRKIHEIEAIGTQMITSNLVVAGLSVGPLLWSWQYPDIKEAFLLVLVGTASGLGQVMLYKALKAAPASVLAPIEYTGLIWAFFLGWAVFGDVPAGHVLIGACIIALSSGFLLFSEKRSTAASSPEREIGT